jgi:DNA-binding Lrp family transcriptional regulator
MYLFMDQSDVQITKLKLLEELYRNSRETAEELANILKKSRQTIAKMRDNLWEKGTIYRPTILLNPQRLNLQYFFMEIKTNPAEPEILRKLKAMPEITSIDGILGEYALIVKFEMRTKQKFAEILANIENSVAQSMFQSYRIIETIDVFKLGGIILDRTQVQNPIDEKKWKLLELLKRNYNPRKWEDRKAQEFFTPEEVDALEKLNLSREFDYFIEEHIIERFSIILNAELPDFKTKFFMRIKPKQIGQYTTLAEQLVKEPQIIELYRTGEDSGLLAALRTKDLRTFREFINHLYATYEIKDTTTTVVVDEHIPTHYPPSLHAAERECLRD